MDLNQHQKILISIVCILCIPAFLINLGEFPFIEDEAIRAIVAYEMLENTNFIVPTINGDPYYYKPPLYNWIIAISYYIMGVSNEWSSRLPTVLILFGFAYYVYWICLRHTKHQVFAAATALTFLTCGRVLFYDSFLGLIDIGFSWVIFMQMTQFYKLGSRTHHMIIIYILTAVAYLMKGFPAFVFLGGGMLAYIGFYREIRSLMTKWHLIGISIATAIIGGYYGIYNLYHNPTNTFAPLLEQSTMRTFLDKDIGEFVTHLITFPLENVYHFLPWSMLTICAVTWLRKEKKEYNRFSDFLGFLFIVNILVYWVSPGTYPRYIIMLIPLYFGYFLAFYFKYRESIPVRLTDLILITLMSLVTIAGLSTPWTLLGGDMIKDSIGVSIGVVGIGLLYSLKQRLIPEWLAMVILLLCIRIYFNVAILPNKNVRNGASKSRTEIQRITSTYDPIYLYRNARMDKASSFYLATAIGKPLLRKESIESNSYYLYDPYRTDVPSLPYEVIDSLQIVEFQRMTYLIKKSE